MREFVSMQVSKVAQEFYVCVCHILESARRKCTTGNIVVRAALAGRVFGSALMLGSRRIPWRAGA